MSIEAGRGGRSAEIIPFPARRKTTPASGWSSAARSDQAFMKWLDHCEAALDCHLSPSSGFGHDRAAGGSGS